MIAKDDEKRIIQHLVDLLRLIGDYRRRNVIPSKGKRSKNRKRTDGEPDNDEEMPSIFNHLTIGFNSTVRSLETMSRRANPSILRNSIPSLQQAEEPSSNLSVVFVCRSVINDAVTSSIPLMIVTASLAEPQTPPVRLVQLSTNAANGLAKALYQPRVAFVGIQTDAPDVDVILSLVRAAVAPVQVPWLEAVTSARYLPVQIESTETRIGSKDKAKAAAEHRQQTASKDTPQMVASQRKTKST